MDEKHQFALFLKNLSNLLVYKNSGVVEICDDEFWHRITRILRIRSGCEITIFDELVNVQAVVLEQTFSKKEIVFVSIGRVNTNQPIKPHITLMPCVLKKDVFEDIIYAAAQMGVNKIVPILSDKVQRPWGDKKECERLMNIMIAACEQSKNFVLPELCSPIKIDDVDKNLVNYHPEKSLKIYFDPAGASFVDLLVKIKSDQASSIVLFFGPEGGLTSAEEKTLKAFGFETYALTPTILRAREAVIVGIGGVRSAR